MTLQSEILDGLDVPGWDDSIARVKRTVANALHRLDPSAEIKDTSYFNHSFVPDFLLTWQREQGRSRDVFLRLDTSGEFLEGDLRYLGQSRPLLLGLVGFGPEEAPDVGEIKAAAESSPALLTEPDAVEELAASVPQTDFGQVVPSALLKGGRGWVGEEAANVLTDAAAQYFSGAREHLPDQVRDALPLLGNHLDDRQSARLANFGRIVWEATGGEPTRFPVPTEVSGVDDAGLHFLLEEAPSDDMYFWRSVGRLVTLERLLGLGVREGPNLASFVAANADRLNARVLLIKSAHRRLDDAGPAWSVEGGGLCLRGADFVAYMASRRDDLSVSPDADRGLDVETFRRRTRDAQVETVGVVAGDGKRVSIQSEQIFDPSTDAVLASVGDLPGTRIASVGVIVSGKHLECDFMTRVASGYTNALFDVASLVERGLPLIWPLTDERDFDAVRRLRDTVGAVAVNPTLFDQFSSPPPEV